MFHLLFLSHQEKANIQPDNFRRQVFKLYEAGFFGNVLDH